MNINNYDFKQGFVFTQSFKIGNCKFYDYTFDGGGFARVQITKFGFMMRNISLMKDCQKKGLATKLYKELNLESLKLTGCTLQSTKLKDNFGNIELSDEGQLFWQKLVKKGLAKKISNKRYRFI
jgi:hypothetical protein